MCWERGFVCGAASPVGLLSSVCPQMPGQICRAWEDLPAVPGGGKPKHHQCTASCAPHHCEHPSPATTGPSLTIRKPLYAGVTPGTRNNSRNPCSEEGRPRGQNYTSDAHSRAMGFTVCVTHLQRDRATGHMGRAGKRKTLPEHPARPQMLADLAAYLGDLGMHIGTQ